MFRNPTADVIVVLAIVLLFFGPKRLPMLGRDLGRGMREFKDSISGESKDEEESRETAAITAASSSPEVVPTPVPEPQRAPADAGPEQRS